MSICVHSWFKRIFKPLELTGAWGNGLRLFPVLLVFGVLAALTASAETSRPNVLMFVVDDMNDMVGPLGDRQAITPNLDRLAREGVLFRNAHAPGVFCAPSRTAIWTGLHASTTGCYDTEIFYYDYPELVSMQMAFNQAGYNAYGAGKLYHHRNGHVDLRGWKEYFTRGPIVQEMAYEMNSYHMDDIPLPDPYPYSILSRSRGNTTYSGMEWGPIPDDQAEDMAASLRTNWVVEQLGKRQDKPFFMALGLYIPHFPNYVPQKYLDLYDPEAIEPPVYNEYDLDDVPPAIRKRMLGRKRQHDELIALGALQESLQAWYASITFADAMLGRVLDALEASPYKENTIIIFWSDQGFHRGEKFHHGKHTLWQRTTRVPFIWAGPGIARGGQVDTTVSLIDIYPTLVELCQLPVGVDRRFDGESLAQVLGDPSLAEDRNILVPDDEPGGFAMINSTWRYIHYHDGTEELYHVKNDPNEWTNLAGKAEYEPIQEMMKKTAPRIFAPSATPLKSLKLVITGDTFHWEPK